MSEDFDKEWSDIREAQYQAFLHGYHPELILEFSGIPSAEMPNSIHISPQLSQRCPECRGFGKYVGFTAIEPCKACGGTGRVPNPS